MSIKGLELKGGKIVIQEKEKDLRIRKNYSLPQQTITDIEEKKKKLNCSASEAIVEAIKVVNALLVEEEPKKTSKKATKKSTKAKEVEQLEEIHDENEVF